VLCALTYKINTRARVQEVGKAHTVNKVMYFVVHTVEKSVHTFTKFLIVVI